MRGWIREPLVHFLALGALLFLWFEWRGSAGSGSNRIAITSGTLEHLSAGFARTWQRPPTEAELKGLVDEYVKDEIARREAVGMGLDRDDTVIRRRLRQKLEFLVEDEVAASPPSEGELAAWLASHREAFRTEARLSLRQVFLSPERRGAAARGDARALLARLRAAGPGARLDGLGDPSLLPSELPLGPASDVARSFGEEFARELESLPAGEWTGPVESTFGLHLVLVREHVPATDPPLADIRPLVEREYQAERRKTQLEAYYEKLLRKYKVELEARPKPPAGASRP